MSWIFLSFTSAFFDAVRNVLLKAGANDFDEFTLAWVPTFITSIILLPVNIIVGIPSLDITFLLALAATSILWALTSVIYVKAIKHADLSISIPLLSFTPLFLLIISPVLVNEFPSGLGLAGVFLIVIGSYILNIREKRNGFLEPFRKLLKEKGAKFMLLVALFWAFTAIFYKIGPAHSSPLFWVLSINVATSIIIFPFVLKKIKIKTLEKKNVLNLLFLGLANGAQEIFFTLAVGLSLVSYVISIKRTALPLSVAFGYFIFKEKNIRERLVGTIIMLVGVILISIS